MAFDGPAPSWVGSGGSLDSVKLFSLVSFFHTIFGSEGFLPSTQPRPVRKSQRQARLEHLELPPK